jgi:hypothetical protein
MSQKMTNFVAASLREKDADHGVEMPWSYYTHLAEVAIAAYEEYRNLMSTWGRNRI